MQVSKPYAVTFNLIQTINSHHWKNQGPMITKITFGVNIIKIWSIQQFAEQNLLAINEAGPD